MRSYLHTLLKVTFFLLIDLLVFTTFFGAVRVSAVNLPTGSILINEGAVYTKARTVTLTFPNTSADVAKMELRNGTTGSFQTAIPFANPYSYTLPNIEGARSVSVRFADAQGNKSTGVISDSIILDSIPPVISDVSVSSSTVQNSDVIDITAKVSDANQADIGLVNITADLSGLGGAIALNPTSYERSQGLATWSNFSVSQTVNGLVQIIFSATDPAGNSANMVSLSLTVANPTETPPPPSPTPTLTPVSTPIPEPTSIPTVGSTPTPTPTPTPIPTLLPIASPDPLPTDMATPTSLPTPMPVESPELAPTPEPESNSISSTDASPSSVPLSSTPAATSAEEVLGVTKESENSPGFNEITKDKVSLSANPDQSGKKQVVGIAVAILGGVIIFVSWRLKPL